MGELERRGVPLVDPTAGSPMLRMGTKMARLGPMRHAVRVIAPRVDPTLLRLSRGRLSTALITPQLLLHHTGARTRLPRTTPLIYFTDDDRIIAVASNFGGSRHPAWFHNVRANPRVTITVRDRSSTYTAAEQTASERDRLWHLATGYIPSYLDYERSAAPRVIPLVAFLPTT